MSAADLFPETLPVSYRDVDEARALAWGLLSDWFGTLSYIHNESTHTAILESLDARGMADLVRDASLHIQDQQIDYHDFAAGVHIHARAARAAGLVVPDGKRRQRKRTSAQAGGDLFVGDENSAEGEK